MTLEIRDMIALGSIAVAIITMLVVSRNARKATSVQLQNTDLTRIRDLRSEVKDLTGEVSELRRQLGESNDFGHRMLRERMEMIRYAQMPGIDIHDWLDRYGEGDHPAPIGGRIGT